MANARVLVSDPLAEEGLLILREASDVDVKTGLKEDELCGVIGEYDALIVRSGTEVTAKVIEAGKKLKFIGRAGVGVDNVDMDAATKQGVIVANAPEGNTMAATDPKGSTAAAASVCFLNKVCANTPSTTGSNTIFKIDQNIATAEISSHWLAKR